VSEPNPGGPPPAGPPRVPLPEGYRQGIITAITVLLGFSLAFFRFLTFEAPGEWTARSVAVVMLLGFFLAVTLLAV